MKYECPHCRQRSISGTAKFFSETHAPAKCPECGGLSTEPPRKQGILGVVYYLGMLVAIGYSFAMWSWWPMVAYLIAAFLLGATALHLVPLSPVTEASVKRAYRLKMWAIAAFVVLFIVAAWVRQWK
jgi:hypothetical protein